MFHEQRQEQDDTFDSRIMFILESDFATACSCVLLLLLPGAYGAINP
jgi:hypothetical protein